MVCRTVHMVPGYTLRLMAAERTPRAWIVGGPGPVQGNADPGPFVCLLCDFTATTYGRVEKHATVEHPTRAVRIEQRGLTP